MSDLRALIEAVKPLEWAKSTPSGWRDNIHSVPLQYVIRGPFPDGHFIWMRVDGHGPGSSEVATKDAAVIACQADYADRILSALTDEALAALRAKMGEGE